MQGITTIMKPLSLYLSILALCLANIASAKQHRELGKVDWMRNYDEAVAVAKESGKPILILFQEVPGCSGCVQYGESTLSHPIIIDAIENEFVPLAVFNNAGGHDKAILKRFKEPAWNFQVMRFINTEGKDIIPRKDRVWTPAGTAMRMVEALETEKKSVPDYLKTVAWTHDPKKLRTAAFSMACFWDGEAKLGSIDGVVGTEAGWIGRHEVVRLTYDPSQIEWSNLVNQARAHGCANQIYAPDTSTLAQTPKKFGAFANLYLPKAYRSARASDQKRHLLASKYRDLPLNPVQRTKINSALSQQDTNMISKWLSPTQQKKFM